MVKINASEKATIPAKHYVGMKKQGDDSLPLAFMTPWGEDATSKKRMETIDYWAGAVNKDNAITIDNVPMLGFRLSGDIRKPGKYGGGDKWRIEDPRGFELEITSSNLAELLSLGTFEKGEIQDQCVWGRDHGSNILVSVESDVYKDAVAFTQITTSTASWKDVKLGYKIILQNGLKGVYLGRYHYLANSNWSSYMSNGTSQNAIKPSSKPLHVIYIPTTKRTYPKDITYELHFLASPKLSGIIVDTELTPIEAELQANIYLMNKGCYIEKSGYDDPIMLSTNPVKDWTLSLEDNTTFNASSIIPGYNRYGLFRLNDNTLVNGITQHGPQITLQTVIEHELKNGVYTITGGMSNHPTYSYRRAEWEYYSKNMSIATFIHEIKDKVDLKLSVETKLGNTISHILT